MWRGAHSYGRQMRGMKVREMLGAQDDLELDGQHTIGRARGTWLTRAELASRGLEHGALVDCVVGVVVAEDSLVLRVLHVEKNHTSGKIRRTLESRCDHCRTIGRDVPWPTRHRRALKTSRPDGRLPRALRHSASTLDELPDSGPEFRGHSGPVQGRVSR